MAKGLKLWILLGGVIALLAGIVVVHAFFNADASGSGTSTAPTVNTGPQPTAVASSGTVTVTWAQATLSNGTAVGVTIKRYDSNGAAQPIAAGSGCAGTIAALTCTDSPGNGTFSYSDTPVLNNWAGGESPPSAPVTISTSSGEATSTAVSASTLTPDYGQVVTLSATVTATGSSGTPTGTVQFLEGSNILGSSGLNSSGQATLATFKLSLGNGSLTASYQGDGTFTGSASSPLSITAVGICDFTWSGAAGDGLWSTAGNWSPSGPPTGASHVCIPDPSGSTTVVFDGSNGTASTSISGLVAFAGFQISAGQLALSPSDSSHSYIDGLFTETGGSLAGSGSVTMNGGASISGGSQFGPGTTDFASGTSPTITGAFTLDLQRNLVNEGSLTQSGGNLNTGCCNPSNGYQVINNGTWTVDTSTGNENYFAFGATAFTNSSGATFIKSGTQALTIVASFSNSGTTRVMGGTLNLNGGDGGGSTGSFSVTNTLDFGTATLDFNGGTFNLTGAGPGVTGTGRGRVDGASVSFETPYSLPTFSQGSGTATFDPSSEFAPTNGITLTGGTLNLNLDVTTAILSQSNGTLTGTGTLTLNGTNGNALIWSGGSQLGVTSTACGGTSCGATLLSAGSTGNISNTVTLDSGRRLGNNGAITQTRGDIRTTGGYTISNTGRWTVGNSTTTAETFQSFDGVTAINNSGTFTKTGTNSVAVNSVFNNTGNLNVNAGILSMANGSLVLASGSTIGVSINSTAGPGAGYGRLAVTGDLALNGTLAVTSNFIPAAGSSFDVVTCTGSCLPSFPTVTFNPSTTIYSVTYPGSAVRLSA